MNKSSHANQLIREKKHCLLQHAHNPVNRYPWGEESFSDSQRKKLTSIGKLGYATGLWCHVMERESFEAPNLAKLLNEHFVSIKVSREERPDVDSIYMQATQMPKSFFKIVW